MSLLQKIGYIVVILCFGAWLYLLSIGQSNTASNITGAVSFVSLLMSVFNPFDKKAKDTGRRYDPYRDSYSEGEDADENYRSITLGLAFVLFIAALGFAVYPKFHSMLETTETTNASDSTVSNDSDIPYDSLEFQGHHYYIFSGSGISWKEAVNNCNDHGGYMAIINNTEENEALYNYMIERGFDQAFFGLTRMPDGSWDYLSYTNKTSDFRDWGFNSIGEPEPNNADAGENYAELDVNMNYGHWNDAEFGRKTYTPDGDEYKDTSAYICEWDY